MGHFSSWQRGDLAHLSSAAIGRSGLQPTLSRQPLLGTMGLREDATAFDLLGDAPSGYSGGASGQSPLRPAFPARSVRLREVNEARGKPHSHSQRKPGVTHRPWIAPRSVVAERLALATPPARRVRIAGRALDLMGASQGVLKLHVRSGEIVTCAWAGAGIDRNPPTSYSTRDCRY